MAATLAAAQRALGPLLWPLGAAYAAAMALRARLYAGVVAASWRPPAPCVSVGNIAMGGGGKTPLTAWLLAWAAARGLTPAVLTRGYGARPPSRPYRVRPHSPPEHAGDEPLLLAQGCPAALVVVDPHRARAGRWLAERFRPDLYLLDDGFQHLAVRRDLDLLLLRPADLGPDWGRVFPAGYWREGERALARASAFLVRASAQEFAALRPAVERHLAALGRPVFPFSLRPTGLLRIADGLPAPPPAGPYLLAAGIAHPAQAAETAAAFLGRPPADLLAYPDHHAYRVQDIEHMARRARQLGQSAILATPKDAVKLRPLLAVAPPEPSFLTFSLDLAFGPGLYTSQDFPQFLHAWWAQAYT